MGRPLKINRNFIDAVKKIIANEELTPVAWTDDDFLDQINDELEKKDQICSATFDNYIQKGKTEDIINNTLKEFLGLLKRAREKVKLALLKEIRQGPQNWQARSWILERKFPEYNLKQISEHKFDIQPIKIIIDLNQKPIETTEEKFTDSNLVLV